MAESSHVLRGKREFVENLLSGSFRFAHLIWRIYVSVFPTLEGYFSKARKIPKIIHCIFLTRVGNLDPDIAFSLLMIQDNLVIAHHSFCFRLYRGRLLLPAEIIDLLKGFVIGICVYVMSYIDTSMMYHLIKSQSVIKLYLFYNMLEASVKKSTIFFTFFFSFKKLVVISNIYGKS